MATETPVLTSRQRKVMRALTDEWALAYDIAQAAEIDNRSAGAVLNGLMLKGLADREWSAEDRAYRWRKK